MSKEFKNAFTLVELAIVIVIIGLLVGGVLAGQELVNQAKIQAQVKQLEDFNTAALTFKAKYNLVPGDSTSAEASRFNISGGASLGGNGVLDDTSGAFPNITAYQEPRFFFQNLYEKKLIKDFLKHTSNDYSIGSTWPAAKIGEGGVAAFSHIDGIYYFLGPTIKNDSSNAYYFSTSSPQPSLTTASAFGLDKKLDDGIPSTGIIRAVIVTNLTATNFSNDAALGSCLGVDNQSYNLASDKILCRVIVKSKLN